MNRKILSLLLLLIAANSVLCQEKSGIRGHIKCKETNEILTGVTVATDSLIGTYTDINGFYELPLPSGTCSGAGACARGKGNRHFRCRTHCKAAAGAQAEKGWPQ